MAISVRDSLHTSLCETYYSNVLAGRDNLYYFIGSVVPWNMSDLPPDYTGTVEEEMEVRQDIISIKKIQPSDISFGVRRINWVAGTTYDQYDSNVALKGKNFYVLTSDFNVYKCLGNSGNQPSTFEPVGLDYNPVYYPDGYWWKYMYSIPKSLRNKFLLLDYMPVMRALTESFYDNGSVYDVSITSPGSGYVSGPVTTISVAGGGASVSAELVPVINTQGKIERVLIKNPGAGYTSPPTITVSGNPGATGFYPPNTTAKLTGVVKNGLLDRVLIEDPGIGYSSDVRATISVIGDGDGASFTPFIENGLITDVIVENPGSGYSVIDLEVISAINPSTGSPFGSGAVLTANLSKGNLDSVQAIVEQTAIDGAIYGIEMLSFGANYSIGVPVLITGDGTGCTATATVVNSTITGVTITNPGSGYTFADITFVDQNGTGASARAIISPPGGHGRNAVRELLSDTIILSSSITNDLNQGLRIQNDYRQFGLIKTPEKYGVFERYTKQLGSACFRVEVSDGSSFEIDDIVVFSNIKEYRVAYKEGNIVLLSAINNKNLSSGEIGKKKNSITTFTSVSVVLPDVNKYSGEIQYVNNQMAIDYSDQQTLTIRTVITL